jgi:hypothetical protein
MTCATCRYCVDRDYLFGVCKRNPPHAVQGFPVIALNDWCGEWASTQALRLEPPVPEMEQPVVEPQPVVEVPKRWWERVIG